MSKFMYGVEFLRDLDPQDPEHVARKERLCELPSGPKLLPDAFDCILSRVRFLFFSFLLAWISFSSSWDLSLFVLGMKRLMVWCWTECQSERINGVHAKVLYGAHELDHALRVRGGDLVLSRRERGSQVD
jgi:hypothetical protein